MNGISFVTDSPRPGQAHQVVTPEAIAAVESRASLTFFRACFVPGRAKELSATRYCLLLKLEEKIFD